MTTPVFRSVLVGWSALCMVCMASTRSASAQVRSAPTPAVQLPSQQPGRVRGVVFDSLLMKPVAHANVMLMDGTATVVSDNKGRFELTGVTPGKHFVAFNTPAIDSLGMGTMGAEVVVPDGAIANVTLTTPSIHTLWTYRCPSNLQAGADSGIVWGTVRNAANNQEISGANTALSWYALKPSKVPGIRLSELRREAGTDVTGHYFACGVPTDIVISAVASATDAASGFVQYVVGDSRFKRVDLLISSDMVIPDSVHLLTQADSASADRAHGHATLHGVITDERNHPLDNAIVSVAIADTSVRTNKLGQFTLSALPAGTQIVEVRRVGSSPFVQTVDLRPDSVAEITVQMPSVTTLTTMNVKADIVKGADRVEYESRRKMGFGHFLEKKDLEGRPDVATPLSRVPGVQVDYTEAGFEVSMKSAFMRGRCSPAIFLDGFPSTIDVVNMRSGDSFRAIEVYAHGGLVPPEYSTLSGCGSILFWSANARW